jgi:histone acetyltransferase (RNA polymerase elongator complex component)
VPSADDVRATVKTALQSNRAKSTEFEIAFFGGSFTAIDKEYMLELLKAACEFVGTNGVRGIRISTRPDAIDEEILSVLKSYGVTAIELGAQSLCDDVLAKNKRGHSADDVITASRLIKDAGFELGLQMMTGLFGSSREKDLYTAKKIVELKPQTVRIYPTITLENTLLASLYRNGDYIPPSLEETVSLCAELKQLFSENGIKVIRLGLHTVDNERIVAGPWHPSFGELCESRIILNKITSQLGEKGTYVAFVNPKSISKTVGQKRVNIETLLRQGYILRIETCGNIAEDEVEIRKDE